MINYEDGFKRTIIRSYDENGGFKSTLIIKNIQKVDEGNYTCSTSNANPYNTYVEVIQKGILINIAFF